MRNRYGAVVGPTIELKVLYGFDDGELREYTINDLEEMLNENALGILDGDKKNGIVGDVSGFAAAAGFSFVKGYIQTTGLSVFLLVD